MVGVIKTVCTTRSLTFSLHVQLLRLHMQRKSKTFQHGSFMCRLLLAG